MRRNLRFLINHWRAKIASLLLATVVWLVVKHGIAYSPTLPAPLPPSPGTPSPVVPGSRA